MTEIAAGKRARIRWKFKQPDPSAPDDPTKTVDGTVDTETGVQVSLTGDGKLAEAPALGDDGFWSMLVERGTGSATEVKITADVNLASGDDQKEYKDFPLATINWLNAAGATAVGDVSVAPE